MDATNLSLTKPHFKTTVFKSFITYIRRNHPGVDLDTIAKSTGLSLGYFEDENNWVSADVQWKFAKGCMDATGDSNLSFNVALTALNIENLGSVTHYFLKHLVPLSEIFDRLPKMVALANRVITVRAVRQSPVSVDVEYAINKASISESEYEVLKESFPSMMASVRGYFHAVVELKEVEKFKISYLVETAADGSPIGRFRINYDARASLSLKWQASIVTLAGTFVSLAFGYFSEDMRTAFFGFALVPILNLGVLVREYLKINALAKATEKSLERLDAQYTELHAAKLVMAEQLNESKLVNDVSSGFLGLEDEESLLKTACRSLIDYIGFNRVVVLLYDQEKAELVFKVSEGEDADKLAKLLSGFSLNLKRGDVSDNAITSVFRSGKSLLVSSVKEYLKVLTEEASKWALVESGSKAFACSPIRTAGTKIGLMMADITNDATVLNENKVRLLSVVANQMAIFIEKQRAKESLVQSYENEVRLAESYSRFVPMETLSMLNYKSVHDVKIGDGVEKNLTVMFSDIRDFTTLCESMSPNDVLKFLNSYYGRVSPIVKSHNGTIDKFMGDGLMAIFSNFSEAVNAALSMQRALVNYNLERRIGGRRPIRAGIGIAKGPVVFGPVGADKRLQLTVLSDSVNLASRLDGLCSQYDARIIVSGTEKSEIPFHEGLQTRTFSGVSVKGKSKTVDAIEVVDKFLLNSIDLTNLEPAGKLYISELQEELQERLSLTEPLRALSSRAS